MNTAKNILYTTSLNQLLEEISESSVDLPSGLDVQISGVQMDSRLVNPGDLFFATFGANHDARDYIDLAIAKGASAVLAHAGGQWQGLTIRNGVAVIAIDDLSSKIGFIASRYFDDPSAAMTMVGVTGTNGKTSCTHFLAQLAAQLKYSCGLIGTLGSGFLGELTDSAYTTPDAVNVQRILADMRHDGADMVAMEVSSQGLHQYRVSGVQFDVAVFTNLTREHLDYHGDMRSYADTKARLFQGKNLHSAVINVDDQYGSFMLDSLAPSVKSYTFSTKCKHADVHAQKIEYTPSGYKAVINTPLGSGEVSGSLLGRFNFSNVLAVITTLIATESRRPNFSLDAIFSGVSRLRPVDGRMQIVGEVGDITAVVDYAHTPDALRSALVALKDHFDGKIWCVFGCGGNRDTGKRPLMAEVAEANADYLLVTDDNPRTESPDEIVKQIMLGFEDASRVKVERDRAKAIAFAIEQAKSGDVVLIAGKGHETYQDVNGNRMAFSDVSQARVALQARQQKIEDLGRDANDS
ncbi:MAG: UDP-N-acetylmuramoyl-L-alanyl-D-glutamate--2,6-diaminopimelate ligase [Pseudohongiellaceae bacterium]|nr:UDP-N-acetylmuramoyl-L-alanyl-D-glutamate--2,6-diaminopimelate ligase [Pseudohongiellaceae bacterium]